MTQENRPISETLSSGAITSYTYQGLTQTVTNPESQVTTTKLDPLGRIIKVTDDDNGETEYQYTVFDALYKTWDPADNLTTINYNNRGDKTSMSEPNMGSWSYAYNVFGELTSQTDAKSQNITFSYNQLGLRTNRVDPEGTTSWGYYTTSDAKLWLPSSADSPGFEEDYSYDTLSRPSSTTTTIDSVAYTTNYSYHSSGSGKGKLNRITYPTSTPSYRLKIDHVYDAWGHLNQVKNSSGTVYYELDETDALGRERESTLGNDLVEKRVYDAANLTLTSVETGPGTTATIQDLYYEWDKLGNLTRREDLDQSVYETFTYDDLNRLKSASRNGTSTLTVSYNNLGNITSKSDVGSYTYGAGSAGPHAVTSITGTRPGTYSYDANGNLSSRAGDSITWYSYNKPKKINDGSDYAEFKYGPDRARFKQVNKDGSTTTTTYYVGPHFEKETAGSTTQYRHNIFAGGQAVAIYTRPSSGSITTQYVHRDHQSSVVALTDTAGSIDQEFSFDAFGARRNTDWTADVTEFDTVHDTERGYTGHEHIDNVRLIHMNGRVQDPILGRMISADPFVPNPFNTQAFNRYSYVYNSPLSLIDPSGFDPCSGSAFECASAPAQDPRKYPGSSVTDADGRAARQLWNQVANWGNRDPEAAPIVSQVLGYTDTDQPIDVVIRAPWTHPGAVPDGPSTTMTRKEFRKYRDTFPFDNVGLSTPERDSIEQVLGSQVLAAEIERLLSASVKEGAELGALRVYRESNGTLGVYSVGTPVSRTRMRLDPVDSSLGQHVFDIHPHPISGAGKHVASGRDLRTSATLGRPGVIVYRGGFFGNRTRSTIYQGGCRAGREEEC